MNSTIIKFRIDEMADRFDAPESVAAPLGEPVSKVRSASVVPPSSPKTEVGLWECSPGRWRRQVLQAELCHFLKGDCTFTPDGGEPIVIGAGDVLYFPANSTGIWDVRSASRKIFMVFDESGK